MPRQKTSIKGKKQFWTYYIISYIFVVFVGEFITSIISPIFNDGVQPGFAISPLPILIFYLFANLVITSFLLFVSTRVAIISLFIYGALIESFLFNNVVGIAGVIFFGTFYIILYGIPLWITRKVI